MQTSLGPTDLDSNLLVTTATSKHAGEPRVEDRMQADVPPADHLHPVRSHDTVVLSIYNYKHRASEYGFTNAPSPYQYRPVVAGVASDAVVLSKITATNGRSAPVEGPCSQLCGVKPSGEHDHNMSEQQHLKVNASN
ncbi:hypothetical protein J1614_009002 [Plenodomus biglobosus]|nr:hypothetical protein J1614_009002 [Plenodomus biglobosus]